MAETGRQPAIIAIALLLGTLAILNRKSATKV